MLEAGVECNSIADETGVGGYICKNAASTKLSRRRHYSQLTAVSCQSFCLLPVPTCRPRLSVAQRAILGHKSIILSAAAAASK